MTAAAHRPGLTTRGAPRLLEHCAAFDRLTELESTSARARLEDELGGELAHLLCRALASNPAQPPASLVSV